MHKLTHFRFCPHSRSIRIVLAELGVEVETVEERPWEWRADFLALNPAGELPVLELDGGPVLCGAYVISEYFSDVLDGRTKDERPAPLFPGTPGGRAEVRRLVDWFHAKFDREVTREVLQERLYGHLQTGSGHMPNPDILRAIRSNLRYHLSYVNHLAHERPWLAGEDMSFADIAAAAHVSVADYLGEISWQDYPAAKMWYARIKSQPAFRPLLADRMPGTPPSSTYANLDF